MKSHVYRVRATAFRDLCRAIGKIVPDADTPTEAYRRSGMDERILRAEHALFADGKTSTVIRIPDDLVFRIVDAFFPYRQNSPFVTNAGVALLTLMYYKTYGQNLWKVIYDGEKPKPVRISVTKRLNILLYLTVRYMDGISEVEREKQLKRCDSVNERLRCAIGSERAQILISAEIAERILWRYEGSTSPDHVALNKMIRHALNR